MPAFVTPTSRVQIISPHPDDEVIGCGILIAKCTAAGAHLHIDYITTGTSRQLLTGSTSAAVREAEIHALSVYAGFTYDIMYRDSNFCLLDSLPQKEIIDKIEDSVEQFKPDILCVPFGSSYNQDHRAVFSAAITSLRPVPLEVRHMPSIILEYEEPYSLSLDRVFTPNFYLDASGLTEQKSYLMSFHRTQDRPSPFPRATSLLEARLRVRGSEVGLDAAEAYRLVRCLEK